MSKKTYEAFQPSDFSHQPYTLQFMKIYTRVMQLTKTTGCFEYFLGLFTRKQYTKPQEHHKSVWKSQ
jgi:hypothetical protein